MYQEIIYYNRMHVKTGLSRPIYIVKNCSFIYTGLLYIFNCYPLRTTLEHQQPPITNTAEKRLRMRQHY
jgi:hypothetical protein